MNFNLIDFDSCLKLFPGIELYIMKVRYAIYYHGILAERRKF